MRILSIGNSFSTDAQRWLAQVAAACGEYIFAANLFIGGCPLKKHWELYEEDLASYRLEINGESLRWSSLKNALFELGKWDVVTLQQVSGDSGRFETYEPYLSNLCRLVREAQPEARILIHKTWAYETDCTLEGFANYHNSQEEMYRALCTAYKKASELIDADLIPSGDVIQYLRKNVPEFDYVNGGLSLNRDGFHLSWLYGRYAVALVWLHCLTGCDVRNANFIPEEFGTRADESLLKTVREAVFVALQQIENTSENERR